MQGPACPLQTRILFHCAHRLGDEGKLMTFHQKLTNSIEDQLTLASIHYERSHYQEATDIYKRLLLENREFAALNVYVALCYNKLDYYDVSQEILGVYLQVCFRYTFYYRYIQPGASVVMLRRALQPQGAQRAFFAPIPAQRSASHAGAASPQIHTTLYVQH